MEIQCRHSLSQCARRILQKYLEVNLKNHDVVSLNKFDIRQTDTLLHVIALKMQEPVYIKKFKITDAHWWKNLWLSC